MFRMLGSAPLHGVASFGITGPAAQAQTLPQSLEGLARLPGLQVAEKAPECWESFSFSCSTQQGRHDGVPNASEVCRTGASLLKRTQEAAGSPAPRNALGVCAPRLPRADTGGEEQEPRVGGKVGARAILSQDKQHIHK